MSKRFIDTDIMRKVWFRNLTPVQKCLFVYLFTSCDNAGVLEKDLVGMSFAIGQKVTDKDLSELGSQVVEIVGGKLHLPDFVSFQYGALSAACKPHVSIINLLKKHDLTPSIKGYANGIQTVMDKDKDKDKEKDKEEEGGCKGDFDLLGAFDLFWNKYPRKVDKVNALKAFEKALKKSPVETIVEGLERAISVGQWLTKEMKFIPHAATWINGERWNDVVDVNTLRNPSTPVPATGELSFADQFDAAVERSAVK